MSEGNPLYAFLSVSMKWLSRTLYGVGGIVGLAIAALYFFQEKLIYVPKIPGVPEVHYNYQPDRWNLAYEDIEVTAADGVRLHAWLVWLKHWTKEHMEQRPVVMFFQENAGTMSFRIPFLKLLALRLDCPVFALSYRGYGLSQGAPNERGLKLDSEAALSYVLSRSDLSSDIVVFGRSLGGAVAIHLVAKHQDKVKALVVENTFTSIEDMVKRVFPPLGFLFGQGRPLNWLVTNKWSNLKNIANITDVPILMLVSGQDEMVPPDQMHQLHKKQRAQVCELVEFPDARHMDAYESAAEDYWPALAGFFAKYVHSATKA